MNFMEDILYLLTPVFVSYNNAPLHLYLFLLPFKEMKSYNLLTWSHFHNIKVLGRMCPSHPERCLSPFPTNSLGNNIHAIDATYPHISHVVLHNFKAYKLGWP